MALNHDFEYGLLSLLSDNIFIHHQVAECTVQTAEDDYFDETTHSMVATTNYQIAHKTCKQRTLRVRVNAIGPWSIGQL